jgi:hypothetical protein
MHYPDNPEIVSEVILGEIIGRTLQLCERMK